MIPRALVLLTLTLSMQLSGCGWMARRIATEIALQRVQKRFTVFDGKASVYGACLKSTGGGCAGAGNLMAPATPLSTDLSALRPKNDKALVAVERSAAERALEHPVQRRLNALYNSLSGLKTESVAGFAAAPATTGSNAIDLHFSIAEIEEYIGLVADATAADDWDTLQAKASELSAGSWEQVLTGYLAGYLKAYFRGGRFLRIEADRPQLEKALKARFPLASGDLSKLFPEYLGTDAWIFGDIGESGFVTRSGTVYQFPAVDARLDPLAGRVSTGSKVELPMIASDLTRVILEAVFDAHDRLPAVSSATGLGVTIAPLPRHDPDPMESPVSDEDFGSVNRIANQAEAAVSSAVAPAIRGLGWASLNNEALAKLIETFVSVTVRKVTEKAAWCWYSCEFDDPSKALAPAPAPIKRTEVTLVIGG